MPQITLEYTNNIKDFVDHNSLFLELHKIINKIAGVTIENCKSRANKLDCFFIGAGGSEKGFVNLELFLLEGRTIEVKQNLGEAVLKLLQHYYKKSIESMDMQITVKVDDIMRDTYFKYPAGTFTPMSK